LNVNNKVTHSNNSSRNSSRSTPSTSARLGVYDTTRTFSNLFQFSSHASDNDADVFADPRTSSPATMGVPGLTKVSLSSFQVHVYFADNFVRS